MIANEFIARISGLIQNTHSLSDSVLQNFADSSLLKRVGLVPANESGVGKKKREVLCDTKVVELLLKLWDRYVTRTKLSGEVVLELIEDNDGVVAILETCEA